MIESLKEWLVGVSIAGLVVLVIEFCQFVKRALLAGRSFHRPFRFPGCTRAGQGGFESWGGQR